MPATSHGVPVGIARNVTVGRTSFGRREKSGQRGVVEEVRPQGREDLLGSHDLEGRTVPPEDVLDQEGKGCDMVHVGVRYEDGADARLLLERERVSEGACVHADLAVYQKRRLAMEGRGAAMGSEDSNAHGGRLCNRSR